MKQPLGGYALLLALFGSGAAAVEILLVRKGRLPTQWRWSDVALLAVATHKLSRMVAKDRVLMPLRAPFTEYESDAGSGEVEEKSRGTGVQRAVGELVGCPYCTSPWAALALTTFFLLAPRPARFVLILLSATAASHFLHRLYLRLEI